jgi:hypothetical protein
MARIVLDILSLAFIDDLGKNIGYYLECQGVGLECSRFVLICREPTATGGDPAKRPCVAAHAPKRSGRNKVPIATGDTRKQNLRILLCYTIRPQSATPVELPPVIAVGITPKLIGVGLFDADVPETLFDEIRGTVELPISPTLRMAGR